MTYVTFDVIGALFLGGYIVYNTLKIKDLENRIGLFPSPEELAREIVKIKIPISELPQELKDQLDSQKIGGEDDGLPFVSPPPNKKPKEPLPSYFG